ncbi:MAG: hypothetical protein AVDCRST_MAG68-68 [uncultured Gemmatimonadetes bacterium]|uniref:Uncharacterized protein n=1 Tax=uncultured Gemmatimonadota bacterium TaxID=203437 RepID=A0A6J4K6G7_9BACT|nr:MAG: hypothetical protein AVDCRST_MAG68-68 [uncultured Gemmatimonadota bacterium]
MRRAAIEVALNEPDRKMIPQFRDFGEDVYRALRGLCAESLIDEVDRATDRFTVRDVRRQDIGTVTDAIRRVIRRYGWEDRVSLRRVDAGECAT